MEKDNSIRIYNDTIRQMIWHENEIRNQRTNWFLVIQGFLISGICRDDISHILCILVSIVGIVTSLSFGHAAWRSSLAISYALACWREKADNNSLIELPPVSLITKKILEAKGKPKIDDCSWEFKIQQRMYPPKDTCVSWWNRLRNKCDWALPYRILPVLFFLFWIIYFASSFENIKNCLLYLIS